MYTILLTTGFGHWWGTVHAVNAVRDWRGDIMDLSGKRCGMVSSGGVLLIWFETIVFSENS